MPRSWFKFSLLLVATASASAKSLRFRQDGPVDPGIPSDCTYFDTATAANNNCKYFEDTWALSHADFVSYVSKPIITMYKNGIVRQTNIRIFTES